MYVSLFEKWIPYRIPFILMKMLLDVGVLPFCFKLYTDINTGRFSSKGVAGVCTRFYWRPSYPLAIIFKTLWERLSTTEASSQCLLGCTMQPVSEADINLSFYDECRLI